MRTRWDEVDEIEDGPSRFLGFSAVTWSLAVPVAFIAGAAVASFFSQAGSDTSALAIPAPAVGGASNSGNDTRLAAEKNRWEAEAREAAAKAAELQMQVEALRDQVSDEARRRQQAEQAVAQRTTELDQAQQTEPAATNRPATAVAISTSDRQAQDPLSYVTPTSTPTFAGRSEDPSSSASVQGSGPTSIQSSGRSNDDSITLQRIIEDTASRSAALSDRRDEEDNASGTPTASRQTSQRRDSDVETALDRATGLETLSASQRSNLKEDLVAGACVTVSLERVLGNPVPVVPLRNLVRDLDSDC